MKVKLWSAILCSCLFLCVSRADAQSADSADTPDPQAQQPPAQTPPQTAPGTPTIPKPTVQLPPAPQQETQPSTIPPQHDTDGDYFSIGPLYWLTKSAPVMSPGNGNTFTDPGSLFFPGRSKYGDGLIVTIPTSHENSLQFTYFSVRGQGNSTLPAAVYFFGNEFPEGDVLASNFKDTLLKLSWNFLTWPYPSKGSKFRVKTLWEIQYAQVSAAFNAPADTTAVATYGSKRIIYPTFGISPEYHFNRHLYLNVKASAFGFPHHADIVDGEADLVGRIGGHAEATLGYKYYHLKTTPGASDEYFFMTLNGPFVGVRYTWH